MPPIKPTSTPSSASLANISTLTSPQKTSLVRSIAQEMTQTLLTISREISRGTVGPEHTAPFHNFIRTIQRRERKELLRLERKVARYRREARLLRVVKAGMVLEAREIREGLEALVRDWDVEGDDLGEAEEENKEANGEIDESQEQVNMKNG